MTNLYFDPTNMSTAGKLCVVCGDKALGYNFNAVTCESCKAFFRRNALSSKEFTCPFSESCEITVVTRRFCQKCRLQKCLDIGMRKEYIMSEEDKLMKREKIEQNRAKRKVKIFKDSTVKLKRYSDESQSISESCVQDSTLNTSQSMNILSPCSTYSNSSENNSSNFQIPIELETKPLSEIIEHSNCSSTSSKSSSPSSTSFLSQYSSNELPTIYPINNCNSQALNLQQPNTWPQTQRTIDYPKTDSSACDIVDFFLTNPNDSSNYINVLMPNQKAAMDVLTKIIHSQKDAMRMIGHLIGNPGDALKIISKVMDSPYHATTVFTKFMSCPDDALEIIAKCVNSPTEILQFAQALMCNPSNAVEIVNKFLNSPGEAMKLLNDMVNNTTIVDSTTKMDNVDFTNCLQSTDTISDTMFHTKHVSSPMVRNLLESTNNEIPNNNVSLKHKMDKIEISLGAVDNLLGEEATKDLSTHQRPLNTLEYIINEAINIEFNVMENNTKRELNDSETAKLNELIVAYKALFIPVDEDITPLLKNCNENSDKTVKNPQDPKLLKLINLTAIAIKRLIKMVKKINAFKSMCQEDQVALLKGGCTEMMILRSIMQYDVDNSIWNIPHSQEMVSSIKSDILKLANNNVYEEYDNFIRTFDAELRKDENIILIMSAIVLFTPNRQKTIHTDVLILEQNSYYYLLRRYLESVYPGCEAKSLFLKLIRKIKELEHLKDLIIAVYLDVNPTGVEPLLREIFDIKY